MYIKKISMLGGVPRPTCDHALIIYLVTAWCLGDVVGRVVVGRVLHASFVDCRVGECSH